MRADRISGGMRLSRCRFLLSLLVIVLSGSMSSAQDCVTYGEKDFWIPDPAYQQEYYAQDAEVWGDDLLLMDTGGINILEFLNPYDPTIVAGLPGQFNNMSISDSTLAVSRSGSVELYSLPDLNRLSAISYPGDLKVAIEDTLLALGTPNEIMIYSVADPGSPVFLGATALDFGFDSDILVTILLHDNVVLAVGYYMFPLAGIFEGNLAVVDASVPSAPLVTDYFSEIPDYPGNDCTFKNIRIYEPGFIINGYTFQNHAGGPLSYKYVGRFVLDEDMNVDWRGQAVTPLSSRFDMSPEDFVINGDQVLYSCYSYVSYPDYGSPFNSIIDVSWDNPDMVMNEIHLPVYGGPLAWLPRQGILSCRNRLYHLDPWQGLNTRSNKVNFSSGRSSIILDPGCGVTWYWSSSDFGSDWGLATYDLTTTPVSLIDNVRWNEEWRSGNLVHAGRRIYVKDSYADISVDGTIGELLPSSLPVVISALEWDDYFLLSLEDRTLGVYTQDDANELTLVSSLAMSYSGDLFRVGDFAYLQNESSSSVIDMRDPVHPVNLGRVPLLGKAKFLDGERLYSIDGSKLNLYNVSDPRFPVFKGEHDYGEPIEDIFISPNLIYIAFGEMGLIVQDFFPPQEPRTIGGDLYARVFNMMFSQGRLFTEHFDILPLECSDPLPVMVKDFRVQDTDRGVEISWESQVSGSEDQWFRVVRVPASTLSVIGERPAVSGEFRILDPDPVPFGTATYSLQLCGSDGPCIELDSAIVESHESTQNDFTIVAYPNPANPVTTISYNLPGPEHVNIGVFSLAGQRVVDLVDAVLQGGKHQVVWTGIDTSGKPVPSGQYFIRLETSRRILSGKVTILK